MRETRRRTARRGRGDSRRRRRHRRSRRRQRLGQWRTMAVQRLRRMPRRSALADRYAGRRRLDRRPVARRLPRHCRSFHRDTETWRRLAHLSPRARSIRRLDQSTADPILDESPATRPNPRRWNRCTDLLLRLPTCKPPAQGTLSLRVRWPDEFTAAASTSARGQGRPAAQWPALGPRHRRRTPLRTATARRIDPGRPAGAVSQFHLVLDGNDSIVPIPACRPAAATTQAAAIGARGAGRSSSAAANPARRATTRRRPPRRRRPSIGLGPDEYFVLGDNSPHALDSRGGGLRHGNSRRRSSGSGNAGMVSARITGQEAAFRWSGYSCAESELRREFVALLNWMTERRKRSPARKSPIDNRRCPVAPAPRCRRRRPSCGFSARSIRETIESLVVAFILAFLFRTFEAEAFVIPTGSMAPTLMGQHKDLLCPKCGYHYQAGASSEDEQTSPSSAAPGSASARSSRPSPARCAATTANVDPRTAEGREHPTYGGDRILVSKFALEFSEPRALGRDRVQVSRRGADQLHQAAGRPARRNACASGTAICTSKRRPSAFRSSSDRPPEKLRAMAQIVYDNDYVVDEMTRKGWPLRWQPWPAQATSSTGGWTSADGGRRCTDRRRRLPRPVAALSAFRAVASKTGRPMRSDGDCPTIVHPRPNLITDFYAYDTSVSRGQPEDQAAVPGPALGRRLARWSASWKSTSRRRRGASSTWSKGAAHFRCDCSTCQPARRSWRSTACQTSSPTAETAVRRPGTHHVALCQHRRATGAVDRRLAGDVRRPRPPTRRSTTIVPRSTRRTIRPICAGRHRLAIMPDLRVSHMRLWRTSVLHCDQRPGRSPTIPGQP